MKIIFLQIDQPALGTSSFISKIIDLGISYIPKIAGAICLYLLGSWVINILAKGFKSLLHTKNFEPSLQSFLYNASKTALTLLLFLTIMSVLGVNITAFGAILAGLAVGIGAALNGTLGNFAGGVMMLIFKPFKLGDLIETQGHIGNVKEQGVFNTILLTPENKTVILANGPLSTGTIVNFTTHGSLRVDSIMSVDPSVEIERARKVAIEAILAHPKVLKFPSPEVNVLKVGDGMTTLAIRPFAKQEDYWEVYFGTQELVKNGFDKNGILAPIPHRVIINK